MLQREKNLFKASLAEQAERYDDMLDAMKQVASVNIELNVKERNLLSAAYRSLVYRLRTSWRIISSIKYKEEIKGAEVKIALIKTYREKIEKELHDICLDVLDMVHKHLIPNASTSESKVFYYKMRGDYYRYLAEFADASDRADFAKNSQIAYQFATKIAMKDLPPTHPVLLGLALNFSVLYYEILNLPDEACRLAKKVFDEAIPELDILSDDIHHDSLILMQLLRGNLELWSLTGQAADDCEQEDIKEDDVQILPDPTETQPPEA